MNGAAVADGIDKAHNEISILRYNDKNVDGAIFTVKVETVCGSLEGL